MQSLESVKNSVLEKVIGALKEGSLPVYQFIPWEVKAPFGCFSFLKGDWHNDLPLGYFQALVFFQIEVFSNYQGLQDLNRSLESLRFKLDGATFSQDESEFCLRHKETEIYSQQDSQRNALRKGVIIFEVRWRS